MKWSTLGVMFFATVGVSACGLRALEDQVVVLNPNVSVARADYGKGNPIIVEVIDERDQGIIGRRYWGDGEAAKITTEQNIADLIRKKIVGALSDYNFKPVPSGESHPITLKVEVRRLVYRGSSGLNTFLLQAKVTLKAIARNRDATYEQFYRVENEERVLIVADAEFNSKLINAALSDAINKLMNDPELLNFLSR